MLKAYNVMDATGKFLKQFSAKSDADHYWRTVKEASQVKEVSLVSDEIALHELLGRVDKGEMVIEADQPEDEEYFRRSSVIQGVVS